MPVYEYQCRKCGHVFEREHAIGEHKKYKCPECSCADSQKLISNVGVIFKGSGFYATDNRKSNNGGGNGSKAKSAKKEISACKSEDSTMKSEDKAIKSDDSDKSPASEN
ncbi:MAG: FmdB family transcriptional regulator [bacterium]|nr:FmdB family transcriptional regulator [bacterium]